MTRKRLGIVSLLFLAGAFSAQLLALAPAYAQTSARDEIAKQLDAAAGAKGAGVGDYTDPRKTATLIIKVLLTLVGTIFFVLTIYAGYLWMTAGGNEEEVEKAKTTLRNAVLGLVVVIAAYGITIAATNLAQGSALGRNTTDGGGYSLEKGIGSAWDSLFGD